MLFHLTTDKKARDYFLLNHDILYIKVKYQSRTTIIQLIYLLYCKIQITNMTHFYLQIPFTNERPLLKAINFILVLYRNYYHLCLCVSGFTNKLVLLSYKDHLSTAKYYWTSSNDISP